MQATVSGHDLELDEIKSKQQATWAAGNYAVIGTTLQLVGEELCEAVDLFAGADVLDVAAGNGNAALAAARRGAVVTASDFVGSLLEGTARRAEAEGADISIRIADAEALPFADASYDTILSTFGVMFVPHPERAAAELVRVCRPGGRIGLANWTPEGYVGQMFAVIGAHVPPPAGVPSPLMWGNEDRVRELLTGTDVHVERKRFTFRYRSAADFVETFVTSYGPTVKASAALDDDGRQSLRTQLAALADGANEDTQGALKIRSEYLEVVATKR